MTKTLAALIMVALPSFALAGVLGGTAMLVASVQIMDYDDIAPDGSGTAKAYINFASAPASTKCNNVNTTWRIGGTTENIKRIIGVATAAKISGRTITIYWNQGAKNQCDSNSYPIIFGAQLN